MASWVGTELFQTRTQFLGNSSILLALLGITGVAGALSVPTGFTTGMRHGKISFPRGPTDTIAGNAGTFQGIAATFRAIKRHMAVGPGYTTGKTTVQLIPELFDGHHSFRMNLWAPAGPSDVVQAVAQSGEWAMARMQFSGVDTGERHRWWQILQWINQTSKISPTEIWTQSIHNIQTVSVLKYYTGTIIVGFAGSKLRETQQRIKH